MRLELSLLLVFLAYVAGDAYQPYYDEEQYPYYYNNPYYRSGAEDLRQMMFSLGLPTRQTVTVTTTVRPPFAFPTFPALTLPTISRPPLRQTTINRWTSTSTITCTKSTSVACSVVIKTAKPAAVMFKGNSTSSIEDMETTTDVMVEEEDIEQQFITTISPSVVQKVETTKMPSTRIPNTRRPSTKAPNRKVPGRKGRGVTEADWLPLSGDFAEDYPENQPQLEIESAFNSGPYDPVPLPFFRRYNQPGVSQLRQSSFFDMLGSLFSRGRSTLTVFKIETSTLTPTCSVAGPLPQCPNVKF